MAKGERPSNGASKAVSASGTPRKEANTPPLGRTPPAKKTPRSGSRAVASQHPLGKASSSEPLLATPGKMLPVVKSASDGKEASAVSKGALAAVAAKSAVDASALATKAAIVQAAIVSERTPAKRPAALPISYSSNSAPSAQEPEKPLAARATRASSELFEAIDANGDGIISRDELMKAIDTNGDGMVSRAELDAFMAQGREGGRSPGGQHAESEHVHASPADSAPVAKSAAAGASVLAAAAAQDAKVPAQTSVAPAAKSTAASSKEATGFELWQQLLAGPLVEVSDEGVDRRVRELFESIDDDHGGTLSRREVAQALRSSGIQVDDAGLASMMKVAGVDFGSKGVTLKHFTQMSRQIRALATIQGSFRKRSAPIEHVHASPAGSAPVAKSAAAGASVLAAAAAQDAKVPAQTSVAPAAKSTAASSKEATGFELWQQLLAGPLVEVSDEGVDRRVRELFESIDDDHGGTLSRREVAQALRSSGIQVDDAGLASMMKVAGVDFGSKGVTLKHFTQMSRQIRALATIQGSFRKRSAPMSKGQAAFASTVFAAAAQTRMPTSSGDAAPSNSSSEPAAEATDTAAAEKAAAEKKRLEASRIKAAAAAKAQKVPAYRSKRNRGANDASGDEEESHEWTAAQWLQSLSLHEVLLHMMREKMPPPGGSKQFNFVRRLDREQLEDMFFSGASASPEAYRSPLLPPASLSRSPPRGGSFASRHCSTGDSCQRNHRCTSRGC